jgi:CBS domain containing-hemolysin-like protein
VELIGIFLLLGASAFFSCTETSLYRANWIRLTNWGERGLGGARPALGLLAHQDRAVVTILVGNNLVNNFLSILISRFFVLAVGPAMTPVAVVIAVVVTFIFGEYLPKSLGRIYPNPWLRQAALPLEVVRFALYPLVAAFWYLGRALSPRKPSARLSLTREDYIAALSRRAGSGTPRTARLATRLFRFSSTKVCEIQIPIEEIRSVSHDAGINAVMAVTGRYGFSRIPVYAGTPENITGVIVVKDLLSAPHHRIRRISRVAESARAMVVLRQLQHRGEHLAVVEDESGRTTGIVSLEDLIEELIGEIRSEA